jgi:hypothetical protein
MFPPAIPASTPEGPKERRHQVAPDGDQQHRSTTDAIGKAAPEGTQEKLQEGVDRSEDSSEEDHQTGFIDLR